METVSGAHAARIRNAVTEHCRTHGMSLNALARAIGCPPTTLYSLVDPKREHYAIRRTTALQIANVVDVPVELDNSDDPLLQELLTYWCRLTVDRRQMLVLTAAEL